MNFKYTSILFVAALSGCVIPTPPVLNSSGQPIKFINPTLGKSGIVNAKFVLLEKSIADGQYKVVNISTTRQKITNERQERIAFNSDLTGYAPDYTDVAFQTYTDNGNYGEKTVITKCDTFPLKTQQYSPCNSTFGTLFIPMGVTKAYVAGRISSNVMNATWNEPSYNRLRYVSSPRFAIAQAGVFSNLAELAALK